MFPGCLQDFSRMFSGCSDGSYWPGGIWWSFQMKVWTLKIQRNPMIPNYLMIPAAAIRWSPGIRWSPAIRWSIRSMNFDNRKVYGDTSITDGLVLSCWDKCWSSEEGRGGANKVVVCFTRPLSKVRWEADFKSLHLSSLWRIRVSDSWLLTAVHQKRAVAMLAM